MKTLKGFIREKAKPEESMSEGYLLQEAMRILHDKITQFDDVAPRIWKEEEDERVTSICFHEILIFYIS